MRIKGFIIIDASRQRKKLTRYFPTPIFNHSFTPSYTVRNLGVTFDSDFNLRKHVSLTCRSCFYHIRDRRRIRRYISLSVAKTTTELISSRLDCCDSLLCNIASKDIAKPQCVKNCLDSVVTRSPHSVPLLKSLHWLPEHLKSSNSTVSFPHDIKTHIFRLAYSS